MATNSLDTYTRTIRDLSERLVSAQRPIRILDAIKWDTAVQEAFFAKGAKELPPVNRDYYADRPLGYDPALKRQQFHDIERDIVQTLGQFSPVGRIMVRMCREYRTVVRMLEARGTDEFSSLSRELYGSSRDAFHAGDPTLADLGDMMSDALTNIDRSLMIEDQEKSISAEEAVVILQDRFNATFPQSEGAIRVVMSDGILADAAAGSDYVKIRSDAKFNERDLRLLEIHEGWVHVSTTLNGLNQPTCTFLSKGPPSSTVTQEGLALVMELVTFASHPARLRRVTNRIQGVRMAEDKGDFLQVYRFFLEQGYSELDSYTNASRVFRGSTPSGGPFTKDLSYSKGFIMVYNFIQLAVRRGKLAAIPLLFCGKVTLEDMRTLSHLVEEGIVVAPKFLPPQFADLNALSAWMCYSHFLNGLNLDRIEFDYANIL